MSEKKKGVKNEQEEKAKGKEEEVLKPQENEALEGGVSAKEIEQPSTGVLGTTACCNL